jgi:hypothetical protein
VWCGIFTAFSVIALTHQSAWLLGSGEPILSTRRIPMVDARRLAHTLYLEGETNGWRAATIESAFWSLLRNGNERLAALAEKHEMILMRSNDIAFGFVIASRTPQRWIVVAESNSPPRMVDSSELPGILAAGSLRRRTEGREH